MRIEEAALDPMSRVPARPEVVARAIDLVRRFPGCFWFRHPDARIVFEDDVRLVVSRLREHGDQRAWAEAQELHKCL